MENNNSKQGVKASDNAKKKHTQRGRGAQARRTAGFCSAKERKKAEDNPARRRRRDLGKT